MFQKILLVNLLVLLSQLSVAQKDTVIEVDENFITLKEVVVNNDLDVAAFIRLVKEDTTFYKAFRNLRIIGYKAINNVQMQDKKGRTEASLHSKTEQIRQNNCRFMQVISQNTTGKFFTASHDYNYYTAQMYASLFFTKDTICGENNIVKNKDFSTSDLHGLEKRKEQLKMLFFNPGKRINGLPFISNKTAIFDRSMAPYYDMEIDFREYMGKPCYVFKITTKPGKRHEVVIQEMTTWFTEDKFEIVARNYELSYDAGVYDFNVEMEVQMTHAGNLLVPSLLRYNGNWKVPFKKRERGVFTATLYDFKT